MRRILGESGGDSYHDYMSSFTLPSPYRLKKEGGNDMVRFSLPIQTGGTGGGPTVHDLRWPLK